MGNVFSTRLGRFAYAPANQWYALDEDHNIWSEVEEVEVGGGIFAASGGKASSRDISQTLNALRYTGMADGRRLWQNSNIPKRRENSVLFADGHFDTKTGGFSKYSPDDFLLARQAIGHAYGKGFQGEACPNWLAYLEEVFEGDAEKSAKVAYIQEWFGYILMPTACRQKSLIFLGVGSNGKGVITNRMKQVLGENRWMEKLLSEMLDRFSLWELNGKYVSFCPEMSRQDVVGAEFKALTGGNSITAQQKYRQGQNTFLPFAKLVFSTNQLPSLFQQGNAIVRRLAILELNKVFKPVQGFEDQFDGETRGILAWSLEGARRLVKNGDFTQVQAIADAVDRYVAAYDTVKGFIDEEMVAKKRQAVKRSDFGREYVARCKARGIHPTPAPSLYEKIRTEKLLIQKRRVGHEYFILPEKK